MTSLNRADCINIPDGFDGYSKDVFCIPGHYQDAVENVLIPHGVIQVRSLFEVTKEPVMHG